jgi:hypothetical protein
MMTTKFAAVIRDRYRQGERRLRRAVWKVEIAVEWIEWVVRKATAKKVWDGTRL